MNWIKNVIRPRIRNVLRRRDTPDNLWIKCASCSEMIFHRDLVAAIHVCPSCDHHLKMDARERLSSLFDGGLWERIETPDVPFDPLRFRDRKRYADRLRDARDSSGEHDAVIVAHGTMEGVGIVAAVHDFSFMGGSLGTAAGEAIITAIHAAIKRETACVIVTASGGARMQEGVLSLMQLPRTISAVQELRAAALPCLVVLTNPTTGGVTASYAMLGDVHLAEPGALIGFAGPRVIEQTTREKLPNGFQRAEFLLEHGMVDMVVHRRQLRETLARLIRVFTKAPSPVRPGSSLS